MTGMVVLAWLHLAQMAFPHFLQWCCKIHKEKELFFNKCSPTLARSAQKLQSGINDSRTSYRLQQRHFVPVWRQRSSSPTWLSCSRKKEHHISDINLLQPTPESARRIRTEIEMKIMNLWRWIYGPEWNKFLFTGKWGWFTSWRLTSMSQKAMMQSSPPDSSCFVVGE